MSLADEKYVSLTSYKRSGDPVASPVWIAPLPDGRLGFTTSADTWKVKRITNNPTVTLTPCNSRGALKGEPTEATAAIVASGPELAQVVSAIKGKYGIQVTAIHFFQSLARKVRRKPAEPPQVAVVIDPAAR